MTKRALFLSLLAVAACDRGTAPGTQDQAPGVASAARQPLVLAQTSILPGTTAVDPGRAAVLFVSNNNAPALDKVVKAFDSYFTLTDAAGADVPVTGTVLPSKPGASKQVLEVLPATQLRPDEWYTLSVQQGGDLQISNDRSAEELSARPVAVLTIPFFTGSAPHVRAVEAPGGGKDGSFVRVHFSEPVSLADVDPTRLLTAGSRAYGRCLLLSGECATPPGDTVSEVVDIAPVGRLGDMTTPLTVNLAKTVRGSGRTVGEGLETARILTRGNTIKGRELSREIRSASWRSCNDGASRCWNTSSL